jgi:hypothetical protein
MLDDIVHQNMKFKLPSFKREKQKKEFFVALTLAPNKVGAILFENLNGTLEVITSCDEDEKNIDKLTPEELISAADRVISTIEQSTPKNVELRKTIFAVPYTWQTDSKIDAEHLAIMKRMCEELDLEPLGFLVGIEAMIHALKEKEGTPVTAIFIELYQDKVFVFLVKNNTLVEVKNSEIEESVVKTVDKLLKSTENFEVLPARIFLQNERKSERVQQEFLSHDWSKDLPFIHPPQVVVFEKGFEENAITHGVAAQMGFDLLENAKPVSSEPVSPDLTEEASVHDTGLEDISKDFGFYKEKDVQFEKELEEENRAEEEMMNGEAPEENISEPDLPDEEYEEEKDEKQGFAPLALLGFVTPLFSTIRRMPIASLPKKLLKTTSQGLAIRLAIILVPVIVLLAIFVYVYYAFIVKANVVLFLDKKTVSQNVDVTFSGDDATSATNNTIHLTTSDHEMSENKKIDTTGKKETGDKAKGTVTIYNKTEDPQTFSSGTVLKGPSDLEFETTSDVKVASTSSTSTSYSHTDVDVQASDFGTDSNLPSDTNFTIDGESIDDFFAKNSSAFSGGTKKEIQVVAKSDLTTLENQVKKELESKAMSGLSSDGDTVSLPVALSSTFDQKDFDHDAGDEADSLSLSAKLTVETGSYSKKDIENFVKDLAQGDIPNDYSYLESESTIDVNNIKNNKGVVSGTLDINAVFLPHVDIATIKNGLAKKSEGSALEYIKNTKGIQDETIIFSRKLPFLPTFMPFSSKNITVTVKSNE